jgi:hypothetical protein
MVGVAVGVLALGTGGAVADTAPAGNYVVHQYGTLSIASPEAATCTFFANKPNYSGSTITGTGGFSKCAGSVASCSSEATLQYYLSTPALWEPVGASARQSLCPPPLRSSTARNVNCTPQPFQYSYRTETIGSIVDTDGLVDSGSIEGPTLNVACL